MRALVVAYYFPPKGGAGTQRFAKFCKYLPEFGVEPTVLTVDEGLTTRHAPHDDASLLDDRTEVVRVPQPTVVPGSLRLSRSLRLCIDDDEWAHAAAARALELARARRFDVVVTTLSPYACHRIGERLRDELSVPWVVDLRDPWALDAWRVFPSVLHARLDLHRLRRTLTGADFVIANVPEARRAFVALGAAAERTVVIPNGFDEADFATAATAERRREHAPLRIVHVGTFHPADLPAGLTRNTLRRVRLRQIEPRGRTGFHLLHALAQLRDRLGADAGRRVELHLYGPLDDSHRRLIDALELSPLVHAHGYVPHAASIAGLCAADVVFVPLHAVPAGERALVAPGKLYEALASERCVLGALPAGDAADLIRGLGAGLVVPPTDTAALAAALHELVAAKANGTPRQGVARARLTGFTRRSLTGHLNEVMRAAANRRPSVHVLDPWQQLPAPLLESP